MMKAAGYMPPVYLQEIHLGVDKAVPSSRYASAGGIRKLRAAFLIARVTVRIDVLLLSIPCTASPECKVLIPQPSYSERCV